MLTENKQNETTDKFTAFIQKNRKGIFITAGAVFALTIALIIFLYVNDVLNKKAIIEVEELAARYNELRFSVNDQNYADEVNSLLNELETFGKKKRGIAGARAYSFAARIYSSQDNWVSSEETWLKTAKKGNKTYLGPIAYFNAAVAAEEQGRYETAIEYLEKSVAHPFEFPQAPRAQFNIGRLYEQLGNKEAATGAYEEILINWPNLPVWHHLARTAMIRLEVLETK